MFEKMRDRIYEHGIRSITMNDNKDAVTFVLMNGQVFEIYSEQDDGEPFIRVCQKVEP